MAVNFTREFDKLMSIELFRKYHQTKSIPIRNKLVMLNEGLVYKAAHTAKLYCNESFDDLRQEAFIGLIRAVEDYDPYKGIMFSSYAVPRISGKILQYLRDRSKLIRLSQSMQKLIADIKRISKHPITVEEICRQLSITQEEYQLAIGAYTASTYLHSIDDDSDDRKPLDLPSHDNQIEESKVFKVDYGNATNEELKSLGSNDLNVRSIWLMANNWIKEEG